MSMDAPVSPYLFYEDVDAAARFLQEAFGFSLGFTSPSASGKLEHAQLHHGEGRVMLGHAGGGGLNMVKRASALPALHAGVYVFVDDVDAHCARARKAGAKVFLEPADQPWGERMYCAGDPEGQFWMFAKRLTRP
jgi:uncharacterized glyoxalase superfamily protein PhnB